MTKNQVAVIIYDLSGFDGNDDALTFTVVEGPEHGILDLDEETGAFSYQLDGPYSGYDRFLVTANDGIIEGLPVTVSIGSPDARSSAAPCG